MKIANLNWSVIIQRDVDIRYSLSLVYYFLTIHLFYSTNPPPLHLYTEPRLMSSTEVKTYRKKERKILFENYFSCFRYAYNDPELRNVLRVDRELNGLFNGAGILEDLVPAVQYVWETKKFRRVKEITKELLEDYIGAKLEEHKKSFDKGNAVGWILAKKCLFRPVWSEYSLCAQWVAKGPSFLHAGSDAQADLTLRWAHMPFCWFVMRRLI